MKSKANNCYDVGAYNPHISYKLLEKVKKMSRKPEYIVEHSQEYLQTTPGAKKSRNVFADEIALTGTGDAVFTQFRKTRAFGQGGETQEQEVAAMVLIMPHGSFKSIRQVNKDGGDLYSESGLVETMVQ